jgi:hypothetical protein
MTHPTNEKVSELFRAMDLLTREYKEHNWGNCGALLGNFGEIYACEALGLIPAAKQEKSIDAYTKDGLRVQIKTTRAKMATFRLKDLSLIDVLVVVRMNDDYTFSIEFNGALPIEQFRFNSYVNAMDLQWSAKKG